MVGFPVAWMVSLDLPAVSHERRPACAGDMPVQDALDFN